MLFISVWCLSEGKPVAKINYSLLFFPFYSYLFDHDLLNYHLRSSDGCDIPERLLGFVVFIFLISVTTRVKEILDRINHKEFKFGNVGF